MTQTIREFPVPEINAENKPFWDGTAAKKLLLKRCEECGKTHYYPRALCPYCLSERTEWFEASGRGKIYSYSVMRRAKTPYAIAYVTLEEGVSMMTNIIQCDLDGLQIGQDVKVVFHDAGNGFTMPLFAPA